MFLRILAALLSTWMGAAIYVVLRSFAIDEGDTLDHVATATVATMLFMAWFRTITKR